MAGICLLLGACLVEVPDLRTVSEGGGGAGTTSTSTTITNTGAGGAGGDDGTGGGGGPLLRGAHWPLDEGAGQLADDKIGYNNRIVLGKTIADESGTGFEPLWTAPEDSLCGGSGSSLDFDGDLSVATVDSNDNLVDFTRFSASFCIRPRSWGGDSEDGGGGAGGQGYGRVLSKEYDEFDGVYIDAWGGHMDATHYGTNNQAYGSISVAGMVELGVTSCWTVTFDGAGDRTLHIYKSGVEVEYGVEEPVPESVDIAGSQSAWRIGNNGAGSRGFDGLIDNVYLDDEIIDQATMIARAAACGE